MKEVLYTYFKALETADINLILSVFATNAIIHSPLYGDMPANRFYEALFADTNRSDISLINFFESTENKYTAAVQFKYHWILADGTPTHFECVDIFRFDEFGKVAEMTIIYDTAKLRTAFENLK